MQLLVSRVVPGLVLGVDYAVSTSIVTEFSPRRNRGRLLSVLAAAWATGYVGAYLTGFCIRGVGPDAWRIMVAASGVPALLILPFRIDVPESPTWLAKRGRGAAALAIYSQQIRTRGDSSRSGCSAGSWALCMVRIAIAPWRKNTLVGCVFHTCQVIPYQVIPYFALGTSAPKVLQALQVKDSLLGGRSTTSCRLGE
uniref:MFS transporter n=1 Tax=Caballeronia sp. LjRoot34 TaxID=3342325 RepID=UPI003F4FF347